MSPVPVCVQLARRYERSYCLSVCVSVYVCVGRAMWRGAGELAVLGCLTCASLPHPTNHRWLRAKHTSGSGGSSGASTSRDGDTSDTPTASPTTSHTSDTSERASSSTDTVNGHHSSAARDAHGRRESTHAPASHSDGSSTCRSDSSTSSGGSDGDTRGHSGGGGGGSSGHAPTTAAAHKASHSDKVASRSKAFRRHRPPTCEGDSDATQEWPLASAATDLVAGHSAYTDSASRRASKRRRRAHAPARDHEQRSNR